MECLLSGVERTMFHAAWAGVKEGSRWVRPGPRLLLSPVNCADAAAKVGNYPCVALRMNWQLVAFSTSVASPMRQVCGEHADLRGGGKGTLDGTMHHRRLRVPRATASHSPQGNSKRVPP